MRVILIRVILPLAGYWSLLLAISISSWSSAQGPTLLLTVLLGLPVVLLASIVLFREAHASGSRLALRDELTGVGNRRAFVVHMQELVRKAKPGKLGLVLLDVDDLKQLNDSCGHPAGDELLERVARHVEPRGRLYRIGGDEFAMPVDRTSGEQMIPLLHALEPFVVTFKACGHAHEVRVSVGTTSSRENERFEDLFRRADDDLIRHKRARHDQRLSAIRRLMDSKPPEVLLEESEEDAQPPGQKLRLLG